MSGSLRLTLLLSSLLIGSLLIVTEIALGRRWKALAYLGHRVLALVLVVNVVFVVFLWFNHIRFPLHLDLMEGTVLQHVQRAAALAPVYPAPAPEYVPLAYNPLYYYWAVPFTWVFGVNLATLRLVAILGTLGSALILFLVVRKKTGSVGWGALAVGLFAAAYRVMDLYLDTAHADSWLLFTVLLGSYVIERSRSRIWNTVGIIILVAAFWFKQHGALFAVGGLLFLTWRDGWRRSLPGWLAAAVLGPGLYLLAGPALFGSHFHYFTWEVPSAWTELSFLTVRRLVGFVAKSYLVLAAVGGLTFLWIAVKERRDLDIWQFQFVAALLSGLMGALDPGSSDNVFIPMGTWFILTGVLGLYRLAQVPLVRQTRLYLLALFMTAGLFLYNPLSVIASPQAQASYRDLIGLLNELEGPVYAPSLGQLQEGYHFHPAAHWVALEDMIRGPGRDTQNHPRTRLLLEPALHPQGSAYILTNYPLEYFPYLAFLDGCYVLEQDLGDRFQPLRVLPKRFDHGWPRYLYRYDAEKAAGLQ